MPKFSQCLAELSGEGSSRTAAGLDTHSGVFVCLVRSRFSKEARRTWSQHCGLPRAAADNPRIDKGRLRQANQHSEASFIKRRRLDVAVGSSAVDLAACVVPDARVVGELGWEDFT